MARSKTAGGAPVGVLLSQPAKSGGKRHAPGATITVAQDVADQLVAAGAGTQVPSPAPAAAEAPAPPPADLLSSQH